MRKLVLAAAFVVFVPACGGTESVGGASNATGRASAPIVGGTPSPSNEDATVLLELSEGICSGVLIAPNLVLTARHCVSQMRGNDECQHFTTDDDPTSIGVILGAAGASKPVAYGQTIFHEPNAADDGCSHDIALIQLAKDVPNAKVAKVRSTIVTTSDVGTAIGYGDADDKGNPTDGRYQRDALDVLAVGPTPYTYKTKKGQSLTFDVYPGELITGESTCFGDSGGPLLDAAGAVIGLTSRGIDDFCQDRPSVWSDVYSHLKLIDDAATEAGHPLNLLTPPAPVTPPPPPAAPVVAPETPAAPSAPGPTAPTPTVTTTTSGCATTAGSGSFGSAALIGLALLVATRRRRAGH